MSLSAERWRLIEPILEDALELEDGERQEYLDKACGQDAALRADVERLLAASRKSDDPDERGLADYVAAIAGSAAGDGQLAHGEALPRMLGPYRLLREIGVGGMGRVYLAERADDEFQQTVAIKMMRHTAADPLAASRFQAERQILATLDHPSIARVFDGGLVEDGSPYLVMEYIDGRQLLDYCRDKALTLKARLQLFGEVCAAVEFAHRRLIVHRDLKPANILVTEEGRPKLLDFGIAKLLDPGDLGLGPLALTRTGLLPMTPEYAAPEQLQRQQITTATDVYALGVILFELLTGRRPYSLADRTATELEDIVCRQEPTRPSVAVGEQSAPIETSARELRGDLDTIVLKALRKEPERRYGSVGDLAADLERFESGYPIAARTASVRYRALKFASRHRVGVGVSALVTLLVVVFGFALVGERARTLEERDRARAAEIETRAINRFLVEDLLGAAAPEIAQGREITVNEVLDRAARTVDEAFSDQPRLEAAVRGTVGETYLRLGQAGEAAPHLERSSEILSSLLGDSHPETLRARVRLAALRGDRGEIDLAIGLLEKALDDQQRALGPDHLDTLRTASALGGMLHAGGDWVAGADLLRRTLASLGASHPDAWRERLATTTRLTSILFDQRMSVEAEELSRESLALQRRHLGSSHPDLIEALRVRALILLRVERPADAESAQIEALRLAREVLGENHPTTLEVYFSLGRTYFRLGRYEEAETNARRAANGYRDAFGEEHPRAIQARSMVGIVLRYQYRLEEAVPIYRQTVDLHARASGEEHPSTVRALKNLTILLELLGRHQERRAAVERIIAIGKRSAAESDADATLLGDFAEYLVTCRPIDLREPELALALAERAVVLSERRRPAALLSLGAAYRALGRLDEAVAAYREAALLPDALHLYAIDRELIALYREIGDPAGVESFLFEHLERRREARSPDDPLIAYSLRMIGFALMERERWAEAEDYLRQSIDQYALQATKTREEGLRAQAMLGAALTGAGRYEEAEDLLLPAYLDLRDKVQVRVETKRRILTWLVELYEEWGRESDAANWRAELTARRELPEFGKW